MTGCVRIYRLLRFPCKKQKKTFQPKTTYKLESFLWEFDSRKQGLWRKSSLNFQINKSTFRNFRSIRVAMEGANLLKENMMDKIRWIVLASLKTNISWKNFSAKGIQLNSKARIKIKNFLHQKLPQVETCRLKIWWKLSSSQLLKNTKIDKSQN